MRSAVRTAPPVCLAAALAFAFLWLADHGPPAPGLGLLGAALGAVSGLVLCLAAGLRWGVAPPKVLISNTLGSSR
jgi:hypothetical protein